MNVRAPPPTRTPSPNGCPRHVCVFCGSSTRVEPALLEVARDLGTLIATRGHVLVWGGGSVGLMGALAEAAQAAGGKVVGVIPSFLSGTEVEYTLAEELIVTPDMRERKTIMEQRADGFIVLPGGIGTLEEMFEILALRILGRHRKPLAIVNYKGFYDALLAFLEQLYSHRLMKESFREFYRVVADAEAAMEAVESGIEENSPAGPLP